MDDRLSRRTLLSLAAASGAALLVPRWAAAEETPGGAKKKLLILGGTRFLGPALVDAAAAQGFAITLFNRGRSNPGLFASRPEIEEIHGDRNVPDDVKKLAGRTWDAVVDTSGYFPKQVRLAASVLAGHVGAYAFVSSISAYATPMKPGLDEGAPLARLPQGTDVDAIDKVTEQNYGALKALCEEAATAAYGAKALNVRPSYIVGLRDGSDRFTYWPVRVAKGGAVLAPGRPADPVQFIDVRDLAEFTVRMVAAKKGGAFHVAGPKARLGMGAFLEACRKATGSNATFRWIDEARMKALKLDPDADFPIWTSPSAPEAGQSDVNPGRAIAAGLTYRPLETTIKDTLAWWKTLPEERRKEMRAGLSPEKEAAALAAPSS